MSIPSKGQTQDLEITFAYNRQDNALILKLFNNTDKRNNSIESKPIE